jgi:hypothetical protein|tara:strand:- start:516 stop:692 length:177 start_codon:yes stop_codon:yes gene_type:complete
MERYQFCIKDDCRLACQAESEEKAWEWLAATKHLSVTEVKKLFYIKIEENDKRTDHNS